MELNITHNPEGKPTSDRSCCSHWNGNCGKSVQQCPPTPNNYCKKCNRVFVDSQTPFKLLLLRHQCCALYYLTRNVVITSSQSQVIRHGEELHILTEGYHSGTHHNTSNFFKEGPHNHVAGYGVVSVPMFHESRPIIVVNLQTWMIGNWGENEMRLTCRCYNHLSHFLRLLLNHMPVSSFFTLSHPLLGRTHILPLVWWLCSFQDQSIKTTSTKVQLKSTICVTLSVVASYFDLIIRPKRQDFLHRAAPFPDGPSNGEKGVLREAPYRAALEFHWFSLRHRWLGNGWSHLQTVSDHWT